MNKSRVENLSDGLFAIILTLLVLELRVPELSDAQSTDELLGQLGLMLPKVLSWSNSFFTLAVIWINHHRFFQMFRLVDHGLFWWNIVLLFWISLTPFPTALMGDYPTNPLAVSVYGMTMTAQGMTWTAGRWYLLRHPRLFHPHVSWKEFRRGTWFTILFGPLAYGLAAASAWWNPTVAIILYILIASYFVLPHSTKDS